MRRPLAWITGAGGLIGSHIARAATRYGVQWRACPLTRATLDLTDTPALHSLWQRDRPQLVIHCAALTRTNLCQENPALARRLNVEVTARLAELAADVPLIFLSTDLVFDGSKGHYVESDPVRPLNVYAETKVAAEQLVLANPKHTVIRASLNAGRSPSGDRSFTEEMGRAWAAGKTLILFTDEFRCPIPAWITAQALWAFVARYEPGLYHLAGAERLSRWEIGRLVAAARPDLHPRIQPASLREYAGPPRAPDTSLDCARLQALLPFPLPRFSEWIAAHPAELF